MLHGISARTLLGVLILTIHSGCLRAASAAESLTYERDIRPILRAHCFDCHGATPDLKGGLDLRQVRLMQKGGESGAAIIPGNADDSHLLSRIRAGEMPPGEKKVTASELETLTRWIVSGAQTLRPEPDNIPPGLGISPEERAFWSFQPIADPAEPTVREHQQRFVRTPIDSFLLAQMPDELTFAAESDRHTLILRLHFDLTGLPPSPEALERWMNDPADNWYEQIVESLLASPNYGERWARHWLDVAGYADSDGYTVSDAERPWAWKYRDYVVRAFNSDKPFDRFIQEQLAGDELAGPRRGDLTSEQTELLTATGFLRMAADGTGSGEDNPTARNQVIADTIRIVSTSLLGLSVGCAQCHDHRYDPIPQTDYYSLRAVFTPALDWQQWQPPSQRLVSLYTEADRQQAAEASAEAAGIRTEREAKQKDYLAQALEKELQKYDEPLRSALRTASETAGEQRTPEQKGLLDKYPSVNISPGVLYQYLPDAAEDLKKYDARISEAEGKRPLEEFLAVLTEPENHVPDTPLFFRGDFQQPQAIVPPAALTVACPEDQRVEFESNDSSLPTSGRRMAFAKWLTSPDNPLVARVIVNRIWLHHFGKGLVPTPADFGRLGIPPTHPKLLDWLARDFMQHGWSVKHLHRLILTSAAWRQSSLRTSMHATHDPENLYYSRQLILRLDAELVRDRMLAASGRLNPQQFGPPAAVQEDDAGQVVIADNETRRSLYIKARRTQPVAMLQAFDAPVMEVNCERRTVSTVATQSLMMMNSPSVLFHAAKLAERCRAEAAALPEDQLSNLPTFSAFPETWQYGFGAFDDAAQRTASFTPLTHFTGSQWQAGDALPDPSLGYVLLHATGGHPDHSERAVILRWTVPESGSIVISGSLAHGSPNGDGVRGRIISSRLGLLGEWTCFNTQVDCPVGTTAVEAGDTIDFITDSRDTITSDSFQWPVTITLTAPDGPPETFDSKAEFRGPAESLSVLAGQVVRAWNVTCCRNPTSEELTMAVSFLAEQLRDLQTHRNHIPEGSSASQQALTDLCHVLLTSNEFLYIR